MSLDKQTNSMYNLVLEIGTTQEQYEIWTEMEMAEFLILLPCRRCGRSSYFFDGEVFNEARNLHCPMEGCTYIWCKACQQEIITNAPEHSCDGSSELKPTAGLEILPKYHFCYKCNELIVRSAVPTAISQGKSEHYRRYATH
ncbi:hypothetical protein V8E52_005801 [Russula decolorans]